MQNKFQNLSARPAAQARPPGGAGRGGPVFCLGIDLGTSGVRAAVLDPRGVCVAFARVAHDPGLAADQRAEGWWRAVLCAVAQIAPDIRARVGRIAVDGTSGSVVVCDAGLRPVGPALMYEEGGFHEAARRIAAQAPAHHIARGAGSALARVLTLLDQAPDAHHVMHQADFIAARLIGRGGVSDENNALKTGYDPQKGDWPDWIKALVPGSALPRVVRAGAPLGAVARDVAAALGLSGSTQVFAGTTDSIAGTLAAAPLSPGVAVTSLGTTLTVKIVSRTRVDDPQIGLYSHRLGDLWLVGGASNTGGGALAQCFSGAELAALSARIDPDRASTLDYYPLVGTGERFPIHDPDLAPRLTPRPACDVAYLHGLLESIARIEARCYAAIAARGGPVPAALYTVGGGAQNAAWRAIRGRVLGLSPRPAEHQEAAVGAARLTTLF